jgi:hypothetical protein
VDSIVGVPPGVLGLVEISFDAAHDMSLNR